MQKKYIKNNGPIKELEMEVGRFSLLIGEQATGKSTIAKSVYFFRNIKTKLTDYLTQIYDSNSYNNVMQETTWL
ncbi:MAG: ATP-binding protein [Lachnospiraceae bacterium]|jgi:predicted ATPase|nr:ATP-binding protein [Lachnospiraceae bacterium]